MNEANERMESNLRMTSEWMRCNERMISNDWMKRVKQ